MIREGPIVLDRTGSAMFMAIMSFDDNSELKFPKQFRMVETLTQPENEPCISHIDHFGRVSYTYLVKQYSDEEWYQKLIPYESARIRYIYYYLRDNYPNENYADDYYFKIRSDFWVEKLNLNLDEILR